MMISNRNNLVIKGSNDLDWAQIKLVYLIENNIMNSVFWIIIPECAKKQSDLAHFIVFL